MDAKGGNEGPKRLLMLDWMAYTHLVDLVSLKIREHMVLVGGR